MLVGIVVKFTSAATQIVTLGGEKFASSTNYCGRSAGWREVRVNKQCGSRLVFNGENGTPHTDAENETHIDAGNETVWRAMHCGIIKRARDSQQ